MFSRIMSLENKYKFSFLIAAGLFPIFNNAVITIYYTALEKQAIAKTISESYLHETIFWFMLTLVLGFYILASALPIIFTQKEKQQ
jgi:hypothetical protein